MHQATSSDEDHLDGLDEELLQLQDALGLDYSFIRQAPQVELAPDSPCEHVVCEPDVIQAMLLSTPDSASEHVGCDPDAIQLMQLSTPQRRLAASRPMAVGRHLRR